MKDQQYIYFEGKTEYIDLEDKVESYQIGQLLFSFLDTDWEALSNEAKALKSDLSGQPIDAERLLALDEPQTRSYFQVAKYYQEKCNYFSMVHPLLHQLITLQISKQTETTFEQDLPVSADFALRIIKFFPEKPMTPQFIEEFVSLSLNPVPDWPLVKVAIGILENIEILFLQLEKFKKDVLEIVAFALDSRGHYNQLTSKQRYYIMQINEFAPFESCKGLYNTISIERRILESDELDYDTGLEITPELISKISDYSLDAYTFYHSQDIRALIFLEFEYMCTNGYTIRKCENCNRYFLPYSSVALYCERPIDLSGKTCKDIAATVKYNEKVSSDAAKNLYRKLNNAYNMRCSRCSGVYKRRDFDLWRNYAKQCLEDVENNNMTFEEFAERIKIPDKK